MWRPHFKHAWGNWEPYVVHSMRVAASNPDARYPTQSRVMIRWCTKCWRREMKREDS